MNQTTYIESIVAYQSAPYRTTTASVEIERVSVKRVSVKRVSDSSVSQKSVGEGCVQRREDELNGNEWKILPDRHNTSPPPPLFGLFATNNRPDSTMSNAAWLLH